jgi:hypothetical protein
MKKLAKWGLQALALVAGSVLAAGQNEASSIFRAGRGATTLLIDGNPQNINIEYAQRFLADPEGLPQVEWHFRWYAGQVVGEGTNATLVPAAGFDRVLRDAPVICWRVQYEGKPVGWFVDAFEGLPPPEPGQWGVGVAKRWVRGWASLFSFAEAPPGPGGREFKRAFVVASVSPAGSPRMISQVGECLVEDRAWTIRALTQAAVSAGRTAQKAGAVSQPGSSDAQVDIRLVSTRQEAETERNRLLGQGTGAVSWDYVPEDPAAELARKIVGSGVDLREPRVLRAAFGKPLIGIGGIVQTLSALDGTTNQPVRTRYSSETLLQSFDQTWEKTEDKAKGIK